MSNQDTNEDRIATAVEKETAQLQSFIERLDASVEKLTTISADVTQLLAVHENRLTVGERFQAQLENKFEKRNDAVDDKFGRIYKRIDEVREELREDINDVKVEVLTEIGSNSKKVSTIEKWMWVCVGGGAVILFAADKLSGLLNAL